MEQTGDPGSSDIRTRLYSRYVTGRTYAFTPSTAADLEPRGHQLRRIIRRHFPEDRSARILDLGCGHGALLHFCAELGYRDAIGIDGSPEQVDAAHRLGLRNVTHGDVLRTLAEEAAGRFDVVVTFDVLEHFDKSTLLNVVDGVHRILKPGGRWIIHAPNAEGPLGARMRYWDLTHELAFTSESIILLLRSSGFERISVFEDEPVPHGLASAGRWMLWKVFRNLLRLYLIAESGYGNAVFTQNLFAVAYKP